MKPVPSLVMGSGCPVSHFAIVLDASELHVEAAVDKDVLADPAMGHLVPLILVE